MIGQFELMSGSVMIGYDVGWQKLENERNEKGVEEGIQDLGTMTESVKYRMKN